MFEIMYLIDLVVNYVTIIVDHDFSPVFSLNGTPVLMEDDPALNPAYAVMDIVHN